jgi:hypothetical protein
MNKTNMPLAACVVAGAFVAAGCDVDKTKDGNVTLPQYEVSKTKEGDVTLPEYKVTTPDVTVGEKKVEVTVPTVDVKTADEKKAEQGK